MDEREQDDPDEYVGRWDFYISTGIIALVGATIADALFNRNVLQSFKTVFVWVLFAALIAYLLRIAREAVKRRKALKAPAPYSMPSPESHEEKEKRNSKSSAQKPPPFGDDHM